MKIVFMGTPDFAASSLQELLNSTHEVIAVYTQPDKPVGRKQKLTPPPVKELANENNIPVYQPSTLKDEEAIDQIKDLNPDLIAVVAYGKLLPKEILGIPKFGCINVHGSLLPKYRGAAPIQRSVLSGDKETGVTTMYMAEGMDTGDIIDSETVTIGENETSSELFERLAPIGAKLLVKTINDIKDGKAKRTPQDESQVTIAPMLTKSEAKLDFNLPAEIVHYTICGMSQWPCAFAELKEKPIKIYHSKIVKDKSGNPGELLDSKRFIVGCNDCAIELLEVQPVGKKRMDGRSFLNGKGMTLGECFDDE